MDFNTVDIHIAKKKMTLRSTNSCLSFISTIWKGEVVMCCFNNLNKEMANVFCTQDLESDDIVQLEILIREFMFGS